jgi:UTP-glucose-1-phosphate uridylyltransferase/mevalonate kinase
MRIFVPGRICLFGEHSDWAGGYRRINADLDRGYTIITGTNQGVYAEVRQHPTRFIFRASPDAAGCRRVLDVPMEREALLAEAEKGGYFSYAAGVAYQILTHNQVRGLEVDNDVTDLPVKKGLSSSAAVCVLVARAFNRAYDLKLTTRGEMETAYMGEITTPSRCGRMDQGCAYGSRPILMSFDGDRIDVEELHVRQDLHFVIVDLQAGKDTKEILSKLNHCYPFADNALQAGVQEYLGPINARIVRAAADAVREGDAQRVGALMAEAQAEFDARLQPACPAQLTAPVLHSVLAHPAVQPLVYGGKGVGSQGDGTAQFIARDAECQIKLMEVVRRELQLSCLDLTIHAGRKVRKALIPAAGFGTRLFPASKAIKKELFPVVDRQGVCKPAIMAIVEEALDAGAEEIAIIVQSRDRDLFEGFFNTPPAVEHFNKLSVEGRENSRRLLDIGRRITWLTQDVQEGFGHAVHCAKDWVAGEPFLLMLGDHLYGSESGVSCARQMVNAYERHGKSVVGLMSTPGSEIQHFGCVTGVWQERNLTLALTEFAEKPSLEHAREYLAVDGLDPPARPSWPRPACRPRRG